MGEEFARSLKPSVDHDRFYNAWDVARRIGETEHEVACTMQVNIIKSVLRKGEPFTKGKWLLEWAKNPRFSRDLPDIFSGIDWEKKIAADLGSSSTKNRKTGTAPKSLTPVVYFARCGDHIKIGFTRGKPEHRLKGLGTANPFPVELIATVGGGQELEAELHERFAAHRIKGEWFVFSEEIRAFLDPLLPKQ